MIEGGSQMIKVKSRKPAFVGDIQKSWKWPHAPLNLIFNRLIVLFWFDIVNCEIMLTCCALIGFSHET